MRNLGHCFGGPRVLSTKYVASEILELHLSIALHTAEQHWSRIFCGSHHDIFFIIRERISLSKALAGHT